MAELNYQYLDVLTKQAIAGDGNAFAEIYAVTYERQYRFAYYFLKDIYQAQDIIKQTYHYALQNLDTLVDPLQLIEWLDQLNFRFSYNAIYGNPNSREAQLICDLPYRESAAYLMYIDQNMAINEISVAMDETKNALRKMIRSAQRKLKHHGLSTPSEMLTTIPYLEKSELDSKSADILLDNVLESCGYPHHTIPVATLITDRIFKREKYVLQKVVVTLFLVGLLLLPLLFVIPSTSVEASSDGINNNMKYNIHVSSLLRVRSVIAQLDGAELPVYETANKVYTIEPHTAGTATVIVTLENGQYSTREIKIEAVK